MLATLLGDSRGLLTLSPVLIMGFVGLALLWRRGWRAETLTIGAICLCYVVYNSGYYLPFGGGYQGPRFMTTMLPFLAVPLALALRRFPGPTVALAGASIATIVIATITHPLVGYETETVVWARLLRAADFQPTIATAYGLGRGWGGIWPFLLAAALGIGFAGAATTRLALSDRSLVAGVLALAAWGLYAILAPTLLGIDHQGLLDIQGAGDSTALHKGFPSYPLTSLVLVAVGAGLVLLVLARLTRCAPAAARARARALAGSRVAA